MSRGTRIGVDIGATAVRAAELSMRGSPPSLVRAAQVPLEPGAAAGGEIRNPDAVAAALRELWHRGHFRSREVILGVSNQRVVVREASVPWLAEKELREALPLQVQEYVPMSLEDAVLDFHVLEEFEREGRRMLRLLLVAAQKVMIEQMIHAAEAARLTPVGLDLVPFAIVRSVGSLDGMGLEVGDTGDEAVVDVGADVTSICVHAWGVPRFVRILPSGGRDITAAVARSMGVTDEEAESMKRTVSLGSRGGDQVATIAASRASNFADEIRSSLEFYLTQMPGAKIGRVLVTGGGSKLPGLMGLLAERLPSPVAPGHAFSRVKNSLDMPEDAMSE